MAQKKKKEKNIKKQQMHARKVTRAKMSTNQLIFMIFSVVIVMTMVFGSLARLF